KSLGRIRTSQPHADIHHRTQLFGGNDVGKRWASSTVAMGDPVLPVCADLRLVLRRHGGGGRRRLEHPPDRIGSWIGPLTVASRPHVRLVPTPSPGRARPGFGGGGR